MTMPWRRAFGILLLFLAFPQAGQSTESDPPSVLSEAIASYGRCLEELAALDTRITNAFPAEILSSDRRLVRMREGVRYQLENFVGFERMRDRHELSAHLVSNAEVACRAFVSSYRTRALWFGGFMIGVFSLVVLLTLRGALFILRRRRNRKAPRDVPPPPSSSLSDF